MSEQRSIPLTGELLDEDIELTVPELCQACGLLEEQLLELIEEGIVDPLGRERRHWRFRVTSVWRVRSAMQLHRDLGVNWAGAALALDLLDELQALRERLQRFES